MIRYLRLPSKAEAQAFAAGIEFVNDSGLKVLAIATSREQPGCWVVDIDDEDLHPDDAVAGEVDASYN